MENPTATHHNVTASAEARARGNDFYKKRHLAQAEKAYKEAASLAPEDPLPLSNLSAVAFEKANYVDAASYARNALELSWSEGEDAQRKKQNLYSRLVKCLLLTRDCQAAEEAALKITDEKLRESMLSAAADLKAAKDDSVDEKRHRDLMLDRLPGFKPLLTQAPEYFPVGHDHAESLFDTQLQQTTTTSDDVALLFCGSGDARNVFATILNVLTCQGPPISRRMPFAKMHMTIVDHKPAVMARVLVMVSMMNQYIMLKANKVPGCEDALTVMSYVYTCQIYPAFVEEKVQAHIDTVIKQLNVGLYLLPGLYVAPESVPSILAVLKAWQKRPDGERYTVSRARAWIESQMGRQLGFKMSTVSSSKFDKRCFRELGVLFASTKFIQAREPALVDLIARFKNNDADAKAELSSHINAQWRVNTTILDGDSPELTQRDAAERWAPFHFSPMEAAQAFDAVIGPMGSKGRCVHKFGQNFDGVSLALMTSSESLVMEFVVGEMTDVMRRIRYDGFKHRTEPPAGQDQLDGRVFPRAYDRIHMSNIPDYIGGHLTTFQLARPILRDDRASSLRFNNLMNPPVWADHAHFQAEYLLMHDENLIARHFGLRRRPPPHGEHNPMGDTMAAAMGIEVTPFMREGYMVWERCAYSSSSSSSSPSKLAFGEMLPRSALEKWLYALLLKIWLPYPRPVMSDRPVQAPLNVTQVLRLVSHLSELGYPGHWLSEVLASVCSGVIDTTARPPSAIVVTPHEVDKVYPRQEMSTQPWKAEFTTLVSIWHHVLSFGLAAPAQTLVPLSAISEYAISFPVFETRNDNVPHFMLLFWNTENTPTPLRDVRAFLVKDAMASSPDATGRDIVHCVTTFRYMAGTRTATFWMRDDVAEAMKAGKWLAYIARTDEWETVTQGVDVSGGLSKSRAWQDED